MQPLESSHNLQADCQKRTLVRLLNSTANAALISDITDVNAADRIGL